MTISNIRQMFESSEEEGGGTTVAVIAVGSTDSSAIISPVEEGRGGAIPEVSTLGRLELALN